MVPLTTYRQAKYARASARANPGSTWSRQRCGAGWVRFTRNGRNCPRPGIKRIAGGLLLASHNWHCDNVTHENILRDGKLRVWVGDQVRIKVEQHLVQPYTAGQKRSRDHIRRLAA